MDVQKVGSIEENCSYIQKVEPVEFANKGNVRYEERHEG